MAKKAETKKTTSKKVTGKTVTDVKQNDELLKDVIATNEPLETETASNQESPEALAFRRGDVIKIEREGVVLDATYKAFTSVYQSKGYKIVSKKQK